MSTGNNGVYSGMYSYLGSKFLCGDCSYDTSCDLYMRRQFLISISASIIVVYSDGAVMVPNVRCRKKKESLFVITMHVDLVCDFLCIFRYTALRSVFPINMRFYVHLRLIDAIM